MTECEGGDTCGTWTFLWATGKGYGKWRIGEEAVLEIEALGNGKVVIHRSDVTGAKEGLTATYDGTLTDHQLGGNFKYAYNGKNGSGYWNAIVGAAAPTPPAVMHWCSQHCGTWTLDSGPPFDKPHYGSEALGSIVVVERFTRESVIMYRTDYRPYAGKATLRGQLSPDGNSIVKGTIEWTYHPCCGLATAAYLAAWGAAIDTVPGSDEERSARGSQTPSPQLGNDAITGFAKDVAANVAKDLLKDWIENLIRNNQ